MARQDKRELGVAGEEEQDDERVRQRHEKGRHAVVDQRAFVCARLAYVARRVGAVGVYAEYHQQHAADNLQIEPVLLVVHEVHDEAHSEPRDAGIDDVAYGGTDAGDKSVPPTFVQRPLDAEHTDRPHRRRRDDTDEYSLEYEIKDAYM